MTTTPAFALAAALLAAAAPALADETIATVKYGCADGRTIEAVYHKESVDLVLSDGRKLSLPQTMSGSGIRYANADESIVFWSKGPTAFVEEGNATTYADCNQEGS
ncbi:MAG TPA: MliC family protein [Bauldia sp.]|nr:MliC family protein [Bauldia sp.]